MNRNNVRICHLGCGHWGSNLIRNAAVNPRIELIALCDRDTAALKRIGDRYPGVTLCERVEEALHRRDVDAVIVATPSGLHYEHALAALEAGKHVFVEKPLASSVAEACHLVAEAERAGRILMIGHTFLYNNLVHEVKKRIDSGELGDIYYVYSQRLNLGRFRPDSDVLWTLAPHDISILNFWFESRPQQVSANGLNFIHRSANLAEVSFAQLSYPDGKEAHLHLSLLDPQKNRRMVVVGSRKMLVYDDMNSDAHIQIYDKRVEVDHQSPIRDFADFTTRIRAGDLVIPPLHLVEPLSVEIDHFVSCVLDHKVPLTDGRHGIEVLAVLEALSRSMVDNSRLTVEVVYPE